MFLMMIVGTGGFIFYFVQKYGHVTSKLVDFRPPLTTTIYDRNGEKIANVFDKQHRVYATFDELPPRMIEALLAIEDTIYFEHHGVNIDAIFRAILKDIRAGKLIEGASTITQQLVKNVLLTREKKLSRKIKEIIFSVKIEMELSKEEILERYLNVIYLGHGYYGVKTAAEGYFHKRLNELTLKEIAVLAGLPKAPSSYSPTKNYKKAMRRANQVITRMHALGWIDAKTYQRALKAKPTVYDDTLTQNRAPYVVDAVLKEASEFYGDIRTGGYRIDTTIDLPLHEVGGKALNYAYDLAVKRAKKKRRYSAKRFKHLNGALVTIKPESGAILALVGGINYKQSVFNRVMQARRQPGSAFKPFIYQAALDLGYSGATQLFDIARTYDYDDVDGNGRKWRPKNYEKDFKGLITFRESLVHSRNLSTINLVTDIGLSRMIREMKDYGIDDLPKDLSLALGSMSLSPLKLAQYYTMFAAGGVQSEPYLIQSVKNHRHLWKHVPKTRRITDKRQAFLMTSILRDVVTRGTGRKAYVRGIELAGKTGTTNKAVDAWFAGYSPGYETIVWMGNDNNTPMLRGETGGRVAGPAFAYFYKQLIKIYPQVARRFKMPKGVYKTQHQGRTEYYTERSPLPVQKRIPDAGESLIF